ncbi:MAG: copper-binding protein [Myxococcota bacterium]
MFILTTWLACGGDPQYIVKGTVVEVHPPTEVVVDHQAIPGLMDAMVMPFDVADPALLDGVSPGTQIVARYRVSEAGSALVALRITGQVPAPAIATGPAPVRVGEVVPATAIPTHDGGTVTLGPDQADRIALTFVYTRCPQPEFCPAMITRLQALQQGLGGAPGARILAVTLDPAYDSREVLAGFAAQAGAGPGWQFGRVEPDALTALAMVAGLPVLVQDGTIAHGLRLLVVDRGGKLIERYDDANFPIDRVVTQLTTGGPAGDPAQSGTVTP